MKKLLSKALAVVMAAALCVGMCATAFADVTMTDSDTGSITIYGLESGVVANAYQIAKATYDDAGNFLGYEMTVSSTDTEWAIGNDGSWTVPTEADLAALFAAVTEGVAETATAGANGEATIEDLPVGSYLIVITGSESVVYGMMIGSVYYAAEDGEWTIEDGKITDVADCELWAKSTTPQIEKTETGGSLGDYEHGGSADLGDTLEYHITVGPIPSYEGSNPEFYVTDEITDNLTITSDELDAMVICVIGTDENNNVETIATLTKDVDYTVESSGVVGTAGVGFVVNFVVNNSYTLNKYAGLSLLIDFCADVTGETDSNDDDDHDNQATLTFATTSYLAGNEGEVEDEDHDYTFNAMIQKVDNSDEPVGLEGAVFTLYTDEDCTIAYSQDSGANAVTAESNEEGYFEFTGLEEGTYYMKETSAPAGYVLSTAVYKIVIYATYSGTESDQSTLESFTITVYEVSESEDIELGSAVVSAEEHAQIVNVSTNDLPSTGGMGTTIFYIIGGVLVAGAVVVLVTRRRMSHEA